jgi:hypothetical protein
MDQSNSSVRNISDTARWVAYFRARETQRPDALRWRFVFQDFGGARHILGRLDAIEFRNRSSIRLLFGDFRRRLGFVESFRFVHDAIRAGEFRTRHRNSRDASNYTHRDRTARPAPGFFMRRVMCGNIKQGSEDTVEHKRRRKEISERTR